MTYYVSSGTLNLTQLNSAVCRRVQGWQQGIRQGATGNRCSHWDSPCIGHMSLTGTVRWWADWWSSREGDTDCGRMEPDQRSATFNVLLYYDSSIDSTRSALRRRHAVSATEVPYVHGRARIFLLRPTRMECSPFNTSRYLQPRTIQKTTQDSPLRLIILA